MISSVREFISLSVCRKKSLASSSHSRLLVSSSSRLCRPSPIKRSSSSLHLQGLSDSSFPINSFSSQSIMSKERKEKQPSSRGADVTSKTSLSLLMPQKGGGRQMAYFAILMAVLTKLPTLLEKVLKIHYGFHAILVLVLGILPPILLPSCHEKGNIKNGTISNIIDLSFCMPFRLLSKLAHLKNNERTFSSFRSSPQSEIMIKTASMSPTSSLADLQEMYQNDQDLQNKVSSDQCSAALACVADEWGHFTDFEELFYEDEDVNRILISHNQTASGSNLCTHIETEDEE